MSAMPIQPHAAALDFARLAERLESLVKVKTPKIAVLGDFCLDKYLYVYPELDEISVETKIVAYQIRATRLFAGVGGTIANNLRALGAETYCFGAVGGDGEGYDLLRELRKIGANTDGIVVSDGILTPTYMKPMRPAPVFTGGPLQSPDEGAWIEGNRYDVRNPEPVPEETVAQVRERFLAKLPTFDAVVVSDQFASGSEAVFSAEFRKFVADAARENPNVFFLCDSRFFINEYRETLVKCNANELFDAYAVAHGAQERRETTLDGDSETKVDKLCEAAEWLARRNRRPVLVTRGASGSILVEIDPQERAAATEVPANRVEPPIDICGAGDATNAGLAFAKALGFSLTEAAYLAGVVSSITIKQIGVTGVASVPQVLDALRKNAARQK